MGSYPFIGPGNIKNQIIDYSENGLSEKGLENGRLIKKDSILMVCIGGSIGKHAINTMDVTCNQQINTITPFCSDVRFLFFAMWSDIFQKNIISAAGGSATPIINKNNWSMITVPIPPLAEQKRIVAKIDELMALCNKLEEQRASRDQKRLAVHTSAINRLLTAADKKEFDTSWQFITRHFDPIYSVKENVAELKKTILTLAMQGKLVPQDPNDPPASELLKEIQAEKEKLIAEGKIKKQKELPEIKPEEIPYEVPEGWVWCRFFKINVVKSELVLSKDFPNEKQIGPDSIEKNNGKLLFTRTVAEFGSTGPNNRFYKGQLLYSKIRPSLNKAIIAPYDGLCSADMYPIETSIDIKFMLKIILSEIFLSQVRLAENRIKMPKLNLESLGLFIIPLPPLAEQKRIVAKIDELMALCDKLETQIDQATQKQTALFNAVLAKVATKCV